VQDLRVSIGRHQQTGLGDDGDGAVDAGGVLRIHPERNVPAAEIVEHRAGDVEARPVAQSEVELVIGDAAPPLTLVCMACRGEAGE